MKITKRARRNYALQKQRLDQLYYELETVDEKAKMLDYLHKNRFDECYIIANKVQTNLSNVKVSIETLPDRKDVFTFIPYDAIKTATVFVERPKAKDLTIEYSPAGKWSSPSIDISYQGIKLKLESEQIPSLEEILGEN